jgi:pentatricopeptide repeat protein
MIDTLTNIHACLLKHFYVFLLGKLGDLEQAERVFNSMPKHNIVSYNILLNLYGLYRQSDKALRSYNQMCQQGHRPDDKTFVLLLHTLSQTPNKIHEVKKTFSSIEENKRGPMLSAAMIAALIRAELFDEVNELLKTLPKEKFLYYAIKSNINPAKDQFNYPSKISNEQLALYDLLMSNIYSYGGFHDRLTVIDELVYENKNLENILSYSWFENSNGKIEYFKSSNSVLSHCEHTERFALADGKNPILIGKNHRICHECHEYMKKHSLSFSSKKLSLRDSTCFHLFSSGICSCEVSS